MTVTMTALLADIRDRLDESTARFWTDAQLERWANEGIRDIARRAETLQTRADITAVTGTQEYSLPTDVLRVYRVEYRPTGSSSVYPLEYRDFNSMDEVWWSAQTISRNYPVMFTMWGYPPTLKMIVYPTPSTGGSFKVFYYQSPALVTGSTVIPVPEGWVDLVALYCEYLAMRRDADPRWMEAKALYEEKLLNMMDLTRRWSDQADSVQSFTGRGVPGWIWAE